MSSPTQVLARLPKVQDIIKIYGLVAKSALSQNFILDQNVTDKIVANIQPKRLKPDLKDALIIEVGPGPGMLSRSLIKAGATKILAIEKDSRFLPLLQQLTDATSGSFQVIHGDALSAPYSDLVDRAIADLDFDPASHPIHLVGNLPFNIATPLLLTHLRDLSHRRGLFAPRCKYTDMTLMFQREVAQRMVARPGAEGRSRISIVSQAVAGCELVMHVPSSVFVPRPKVDAAVVRLVPRSGVEALGGLERIETVSRWLFGMRRKTVRNNLMAFHDEETVQRLLSESGIAPGARAQELTTESIVRLSMVAAKMGLVYDEDHPRPQCSS
ncbi:S-adenosyl-L-methionine-dependent methyltransferase [Catenaria anguillulae PL171]|uniref:rRNA adenine N(6)-methyltransferase n=1 Tax=Catenaria anguillulae PL171 TaxID=765915 RepID=A0A1Y2HRA9_9FUNG|nr:S-adenosyl-L-methionine-dependent methyltransferase [Catenaria anguillulae PL171]